jgi:chitinase
LPFAVFALPCLLSVASAAPAPAQPFRVIGYAMDRADPAHIDAAKLTHLIYAFALVNAAGEAYLPSPQAPQRLAAFIALKERAPELRVLLSIGGWGADYFSDAALTETSRNKFARSAISLMERHHLDGLDLDWEYPGQPGPGIRFRAEDKGNFTLLLKTVREQLDVASAAAGRGGADRYTLSIATSDRRYFEHTEMPLLHRYVDWMNVMTYDRFGAFSRTTGHHAGLLASQLAPPGTPNTESAVEEHREAGIPPRKIVVGAAFYGRGFEGVKPEHNGLFQPYERLLQGDLSYARLAKEFIGQNGFERHWDADAKAAYLWNPTTRTFISYEDPESLTAKAQFVKERGLGGVMYWEQSEDPDGVLLNALAAGLQ